MLRITGFARAMHARQRAMTAALAGMLGLAIAGSAMAQGFMLDKDAWTTNGPVSAMVASGDTVYIAGGFSRIGPYTGSFTGVDLSAGLPLPGWPRVNGRVFASVSDGAGGAYIGGDFTRVAGFARAGLAHVRADRSVSNWNPGADRTVYVLERIGGIVFAGGEFSTLGGQPRSHIGAIDAATGLATPWNPGADNTVLVLAAGSGTLYAGGYFANIGGQVRSGVAAIDAATGEVTAWDAHPVYPSIHLVTALAVQDSTVYVGGAFLNIGGQPREYVAALDGQTGEATGWNPGSDHWITAFAPNGSTIYVGGYFRRIGGASRSGVAELDVITGIPTAFDPTLIGSPSAMLRLGDALYIVGPFENVGGQSRLFAAAVDVGTGALRAWDPSATLPAQTMVLCATGLCIGGEFNMMGGVQRNGLAAIDVATGRPTSWNPQVSGGVVTMALNGSALHLGGQLSGIGGQARSKLGAVDVTTGEPTSWNPSADLDVESISLLGGTIYVGGEFNTVGGQPRRRLAAVDANTGAVLPWNPSVDDPGYEGGRVFLVAAHGATVYAGGSFGLVGGQHRTGVAAIDAASGAVLPWNPGENGLVHSVAFVGSTPYVGGDFPHIGGANRYVLAALDSATGLATSWDPRVEDGYVFVVHASGGKVYAGGLFGRVDGVNRPNFAEIDPITGHVTSWNPWPDGLVTSIVRNGTYLCMGGEFEHVVGEPQRGFAIFRSPADVVPPTLHLLSPNGHETAYIGQPLDIAWSANDNVGVVAVDLQVSHTGTLGPWETIAAGLPNSGHFAWTVTGPMAFDEAWVRAIVRDAGGNTAADTSDAAFTILEPTVPTMVELFRAVPAERGIRVEWRMSDPGAWREVTLDRAAEATGAWTRVHAELVAEGRLSVVTDADVASGQTWWYRLSGVDQAGYALTLGTLSARAGERITAWALAPLAPNPSAGRTSVSYAVPMSGRVRLTLADVQGREVAVLLDEAREPGRYVASLDATDLRPGMYFLRMQSGGLSLVRRLVLAR